MGIFVNKTAIIGVPNSSNSDNVGRMLINFGVTEEAGLTSVFPMVPHEPVGAGQTGRAGLLCRMLSTSYLYTENPSECCQKKKGSFLYISIDLKHTLAASNIVLSLV